MYIAIDGHGALDELALLQLADGDREVVQHTEALAVIGKGMVKAATDVHAGAIAQSELGGEDGAAGVQHEGVDHLRRIWDLHLQLFTRAETAFHQLVDVVRRVHQHHVGFRGGLRFHKVGVVNHALRKQALANEAVLVGAKDVITDREEVLLAVDKLEREHGVVMVRALW